MVKLDPISVNSNASGVLVGNPVALVLGSIATILVFCGLACTRAEDKPAGIEPRVDDRLDNLALYTAETVVLGEVVSLTRLVDKQVSSSDLGSYAATLRIKELVQGNAAPPELKVYFFANPHGGNGSLVFGRDRVAFFSLRKQGPFWRFVRDNQDSYMPSYRTTFPKLNVEHGKTAGQRIADILLEPVGDGTDGEFLEGRALEAYEAAGFSYTRKSLLRLVRHQSAKVRLSACLVLAGHFFGGLDCIPETSIDPAFEHWAKRVRDNRKLFTQQLSLLNLDRTLSPPLIAGRMPWTSAPRVSGELYEAMAQSSDREMALYGLRALGKEGRVDQRR